MPFFKSSRLLKNQRTTPANGPEAGDLISFNPVTTYYWNALDSHDVSAGI
jgi:hypothetical protein